MLRRFVIFCLCLTLVPLVSQSLADDEIFSGPQVDEQLPPFKAIQLVGKEKGTDFDLIEEAGEDPLLLIFFHKLTRPAYGMTTTLMKYARSKSEKPLKFGIIFLNEDVNVAKSMGVLPRFPQDARIGVSPDGIEGPGAYGLNRNVTLTVLVADKGKVAANFALVQPSTAADGPKILKAVADLIGEEAPKIEELTGRMEMRPAAAARERLDRLLRALVANKGASEVDPANLIARIDQLAASDNAARRDLINRAKKIVDSGNIKRYGDEQVQAAIKKWAETSMQPARN